MKRCLKITHIVIETKRFVIFLAAVYIYIYLRMNITENVNIRKWEATYVQRDIEAPLLPWKNK
jgi:hypothetical protein